MSLSNNLTVQIGPETVLKQTTGHAKHKPDNYHDAKGRARETNMSVVLEKGTLLEVQATRVKRRWSISNKGYHTCFA